MKITGLVQGVFFRASTKDEAEKINLTGWVKNLPDGSVEATFEGDEQSVIEVLKWCKKGPKSAHVKGTQVQWEEPKENQDSEKFKIIY